MASQSDESILRESQAADFNSLYEINDDPKRKEFLDDLFSYMQKRGTPINRLPIMAKSVLDLYELYNLVIARGGLVDVINKKLWQEIIKGLHLPSSITSAAFTLRTQYMKYLYPYECEKKNLSTPAELQSAIDGNRREGRRSSYGQFDSQMQGQLQMRSPNAMSQMSPLSLVTHGANSSNQNHRLMGMASMGHMSAAMNPHDYGERMLEYIKIIQNNTKDLRRSQSPEQISREALEMSRLALWSMSMANTSPPISINTSPPNLEPQREALNLAESPPHNSTLVKRERDRDHQAVNYTERGDIDEPPPNKRSMPAAAISTVEKSQNMHGLQQTQGHHVHTQQLQAHSQRQSSHQKLNSSHDDRDDHSDTSAHENNLIIDTSNERPNRSSSPQQDHSGVSPFINFSSPTSMLSGMQFRITSRGNSTTGEQQLIVTMELNGIQYEGVLFANPASLAAAATAAARATGVNTTNIATESNSGVARPKSTSPGKLNANNNNNTIDERNARVLENKEQMDVDSNFIDYTHMINNNPLTIDCSENMVVDVGVHDYIVDDDNNPNLNENDKRVRKWLKSVKSHCFWPMNQFRKSK